MNLGAVFAGAAAIAALGVALPVAVQRRDLKGRAFVLMASLVAVWNAYFALLFVLPCTEVTWKLLRVPAVAVALTPTAILFFFHVSSSKPRRPWHVALWVSLGLAIAVVLTNPLGLVVRSLTPGVWGCRSEAGPLYHLHTANVILCAIATFWLCVTNLRVAQNARERLLARFWLLSAAVALPLGVTNLLPAYGVPMYPLGNLGSAVWASIIAYAMVRHRLLDVEIWISRFGTMFLAGLLTIVPAYAAIVVLQIHALGRAHVELSSAVFFALIAVVVLFPLIQRRLEAEFAKRAFPYKIEQRTSLEMVSRAVFREKNRERLLEVIAGGLAAVFRPPNLAIFLRVPEAAELRLVHHLGEPPPDRAFPLTSALVAEIEDASLSLLQSELLESKKPRAREVGELLARNRWTVCVPMKTQSRVVGFLALGLKEGRDWYMLTELEALERLGDELALALENIYLHEQAALAQQALERVERLSAVGTMVAGIVHEVRNPLSAFSTFMQVAKERKGDPDLIETSLPVIKGEIDRVQRLLEQLLHATRSKTPEFAAVDLAAAASEVVNLLKPQAKHARVELKVEPLAQGLLAFADPDRVRQVLFNLTLNAIEASGKGEEVTIQVARAEKNGRSYAEVRVRDRGPGVPPEVREKIFQPFFTTKKDGTGLGLALCLQIAEEHQGYIEIRSPDGPGTIFAAGFPEYVAEVHAALLARPKQEDLQLTPEEEQQIRSLVGNIKLPPEILRLARQVRPKR
jgi:signal transduction histidine kinase